MYVLRNHHNFKNCKLILILSIDLELLKKIKLRKRKQRINGVKVIHQVIKEDIIKGKDILEISAEYSRHISYVDTVASMMKFKPP